MYNRLIVFVCILHLIPFHEGLSQDNSTLIENLRSNLRYKFVLDFLIQHNSEKAFFGEISEKESQDSTNFEVLENDESKNQLERFRYYYWFSLYKVGCLDTKDSLFLLVLDYTGPQELFLFDNNLVHPILLDTFSINGGGGTGLELTNLNERPVMIISRTSPGVGYFIEQEAIAGIYEKKFKILFSTKILEVSDWMVDEDSSGFQKTHRTKSTYELVDINNDGFLDIAEQVTEDIISLDQGSYTVLETAELI